MNIEPYLMLTVDVGSCLTTLGSSSGFAGWAIGVSTVWVLGVASALLTMGSEIFSILDWLTQVSSGLWTEPSLMVTDFDSLLLRSFSECFLWWWCDRLLELRSFVVVLLDEELCLRSFPLRSLSFSVRSFSLLSLRSLPLSMLLSLSLISLRSLS